MKVWPVDSRKTMLKPQDIFAVASYEYKEGLEAAKSAAKQAGVSPERMSFIIMVKEYSDPQLIRIRAGNTLFTIIPLPDRVGFVRGYNGDIAPNYIANIIEFAESARKIGFDKLFASTTETVVRALKLAARRAGMEVLFDSKAKLAMIKTGPERD